MQPIRKLSLVLLLLSAGAVQGQTATPAEPPVTVESDTAQADVRGGVSVYQGDVVMVRGNVTIYSDKLTAYTENNELHRVQAQGAPVRFVQAADPATDSKEIRGQALHLEYRAADELLILTEDAQLWQGGNAFSGKRIEYYLEQELVKANADTPGDTRVRTTLQPE